MAVRHSDHRREEGVRMGSRDKAQREDKKKPTKSKKEKLKDKREKRRQQRTERTS